ncbi:hypothetical protein L6452_03001 [Arctium lappa]|uniref:Uncharacterized protein n=1 Tax=Arctium lappa TaxID=4217 RepID=A0ACB9FL59_ARCLA|nr:hypothetical protein L6452_03001 [Arctium lappa]
MGYEGPTEVYKLFKSKFSPQWRFFVHTLQHCISRKTTGWSEFSSTIAYALVCLATSRKFNFSQMILNDLLSNLDTKTKTKRFYMYPRFVQEVINQELTDLPSLEEVYVPKPPKGKVFSNMRRPSKDFSETNTPLFSTMMVVSHSHGEASGSKPTSDQPTDDLPTPFISNDPPQIPFVKPISPITKTYVRKKVQKVPSLPVSSPQKPASPLMEHSPLENIQRETTGGPPNPKKDSVNITKTFPTKTLDEQSSKGPRCQETKGVEGAFARQKASTKRFKDPSRVVNTPKGVEDRYNYDELMETYGNVNLDVINQGLEIKELKKVITSQQVQITKLKKMVLSLVHKKQKKQYVLKRRGSAHDASKKGESSENMKFQVEGEFDGESEKKCEKETGKAAETVKTAVTQSAAEIVEVVTTAPTVETDKPAAETEMSKEEIDIVETLVKAKHDTPKATQKAKGVVIKEGESEKKRTKVSVTDAKKKGKEKMVEHEKLVKKQKQIDLDAELAKELNVQFETELEKEKEIQKAKDRKIALELAKRLNEEYQKSLKSAAKKVTMKASKKRQPSQTFLANQERRKMINFLKGSIGVPEGMFTNMSFGRLEELYKKEMTKLQGDFSQRVEFERKMKQRHDLNIQQPFPDSEEGTPTKEKAEVKKEETLAQKIKVVKIMKSIASKKQAKRPRTEEVEKEKESERMKAESRAEHVETPTEKVEKQEKSQEQTSQQSSEQPRQPVQFDLYMTVTDEEPVKADPISVNAPEIIHWDSLVDKRTNTSESREWVISMKFIQPGERSSEVVPEQIWKRCIRVKYLIKDLHHENGFKRIDHWMLFERCGVYVLTIDKSYHEYYLVDKVYDHSKAKLQGMLKAKLVCAKGSEMARIVIKRTINQSLGLNPDLGI